MPSVKTIELYDVQTREEVKILVNRPIVQVHEWMISYSDIKPLKTNRLYWGLSVAVTEPFRGSVWSRQVKCSCGVVCFWISNVMTVLLGQRPMNKEFGFVPNLMVEIYSKKQHGKQATERRVWWLKWTESNDSLYSPLAEANTLDSAPQSGCNDLFYSFYKLTMTCRAVDPHYGPPPALNNDPPWGNFGQREKLSNRKWTQSTRIKETTSIYYI